MEHTTRKIKVENLTSTRSGEAVRNQFTIRTADTICFQSYDSLIAIYNPTSNELILGCDFDYSRTTAKYLHQWMHEHCYNILRNLPSASSFSGQLWKAIENGFIIYDKYMR